MQRIRELPGAFGDYRQAHGVLDFAVFEDAGESAASLDEAIRAVVPDANLDRLKRLGSRSLDDQAFFGHWFDAKSGRIVHTGNVDTFGNPGEGGDFARAFLSPPYGLFVLGPEPNRAIRPDVDALFGEVRQFILPPNVDHSIRDWANPRLPEVSRYFKRGMEWWGVFLFTIHVPAIGRLTAIAGSATD